MRWMRAIVPVLFALCLGSGGVLAQITVLDQAQDAVSPVEGASAVPSAPPPPCGTRPITIARMSWPSSELLAEIHARILQQTFDCQVQIVPGDLAATASSMGSTGQPAAAPEMWVTRIADVWNAGIETQMLRPSAPTYNGDRFEGWFLPAYVAASQPDLKQAAQLATSLPGIGAGNRLRFVSCPPDWACAVINRNLVRAWGLEDVVDIVEPANRFEMDKLIAEAVSRSEPIVFYYWQPNAILAQFGFVPLDMGSYDEEAAKCLAQLQCPDPKPSSFPPETVVNAVSEWVFAEAPLIAGYFGRATLPLADMNQLLAQLSEPGMTAPLVADRFVAERGDLWRAWSGTAGQ